MTVEKLIDQLKMLPKDMDVYILNSQGDFSHER